MKFLVGLAGCFGELNKCRREVFNETEGIINKSRRLLMLKDEICRWRECFKELIGDDDIRDVGIDTVGPDTGRVEN